MFGNPFTRVQAPPNGPGGTHNERVFARQFGTKARRIRFGGRDDLVGLVIVGRTQGIRVEETPAGRQVRALDVVNGVVVPTKRVLRLRFRDSHTFLVPGIRGWVA